MQGDPAAEFWRKHCVVWDGLVLEAGAGLATCGATALECDLLIVRRADWLTGDWHTRHSQEGRRARELRAGAGPEVLAGPQYPTMEATLMKVLAPVHHSSDEASARCREQLVAVRTELLPALLLEFGTAVGEAEEGLATITRVPPGFRVVVSNFARGLYRHAHEPLADIRRAVRDWGRGCGAGVARAVLPRLAATTERFLARVAARQARPGCLTRWPRSHPLVLFVGPVRLPGPLPALLVLQLSGVGRNTRASDLLSSYTQQLLQLPGNQGCQTKG